MDVELSKHIWGSDLSDDELQEWVKLSNERKKDCKNDKGHEGETIDVRPKTMDNLSANTNA
jgi:hypothetical protein